MEKNTFTVLGMSCGHCKMAVEKALTGIDGVADAVVNLNEKNVTVSYDTGKTNLDILKEVIRKAGYEAQ